jgi:O-antigen ligase
VQALPERNSPRRRESFYSARQVRANAAQLLDKTIFFALLALIALTAIPYGASPPWWEAYFECAVFALMGLRAIEALLGGSWRMSGLSLLIPLFALIIFAFIQTIPIRNAANVAIKGAEWRTISADSYETWRFVLKVLALVLAGEMLLRYTSSQQRLLALINVIVGVGVASALFGILRQTTQGNTPGFILPYLIPNQGYGQFINYNHFAFLMEMALGLVLGLIVGGGIPQERLLTYLALPVPVVTALVLSNSRGGIFSLLSQLIFIALFFSAVRPWRESLEGRRSVAAWLWHIGTSLITRTLLALCLIVVATVGIVWMGGDPLIKRMEALSREINTGDSDTRDNVRRIEIWQATWNLVKDYPIFGVGFSGYWAAIPAYHNASGQSTPQQAHNDYLEVLASGGIFGAAIMAWFVIVLIRRALKRLRSPDSFRRAACFGALCGLFGVGIHSFFDFGLHITINALIFTALVVIATANGRLEYRMP